MRRGAAGNGEVSRVGVRQVADTGREAEFEDAGDGYRIIVEVPGRL